MIYLSYSKAWLLQAAGLRPREVMPSCREDGMTGLRWRRKLTLRCRSWQLQTFLSTLREDHVCEEYIANTRHWTNVVLMWANIKTTLGQSFVFAGIKYGSLDYKGFYHSGNAGHNPEFDIKVIISTDNVTLWQCTGPHVVKLQTCAEIRLFIS